MATELSSTKVAGGTLRRVKHASAATKTDMTFALFTPAATVEPEGGWPVIYEPEDKPVSADPRDAGPRRHARRDV